MLYNLIFNNSSNNVFNSQLSELLKINSYFLQASSSISLDSFYISIPQHTIIILNSYAFHIFSFFGDFYFFLHYHVYY